MLVRLLRDTKIMHKAGEIVEVSPTEYSFLVSVQSAVPAQVAQPETPEPIAKKTGKATKK